jgi:DNA invertase Pin-like site-specific DNA recombinase
MKSKAALIIPRRKAYSYVRFSTPDQAKGDSKRRQIAMTAEYAERHNLDLDDSLTFKMKACRPSRARTPKPAS